MFASENSSSMRPRVSIGLPVYNGEPFVRQALESLLAQTYTDFELIISDNASTDRTAEICREFASRDSRIHYHRLKENIGVDRNFNRTFELSGGEFFRWAAADDLCAPTLLQRSVELLDSRKDVVLCYPKSRYIDDHGDFLKDYEDNLHIESPLAHERFASYLRRIDMCNAAFGMIRSSVLRQTKLYGIYADSDIVYLGELVLYGNFFELPEFLFFRRIHSGMAVRKYPSAHERMLMSEPTLGKSLSFPHWSVFFGFLSAINRAPVSLSERLRCCLDLRIWFKRRGSGLGLDMKVAAKHFARKVLGKKPRQISALPTVERKS
jgi:glycosyltransferase involved in cell wall biosynthesis